VENYLSVKIKKQLLYLGSNLERDTYRWLENNLGYDILLSREYPEEYVVNEALNYYEYESFGENVLFDKGNYLEIYKSILNDFNVYLLFTRFSKYDDRRNLNKIDKLNYCSFLITCAIGFILDRKYKKIIFSYQPHNLPIYVFYHVSILLGLDVYCMSLSAYVQRNFVFSHRACDLIVNKSSCPINSMDLLERNVHRSSSILGHFFKRKIVFKSLPYLVNYKKLTSKRGSFIDSEFVIFFLHYQPEQTTLPDGGIFVDQLLAIEILKDVCNSLNLILVVREHPDTFQYFNSAWRSRYFLRKLKSLNVILDDPFLESEVLLRRARVVTSITGTALQEALSIGKPVVAFGNSVLKGWSQSFDISYNSMCKDFLNKFSNNLTLNADYIRAEYQNYLSKISPFLFGQNNRKSLRFDGQNLRNFRNSALINFLKDL
jgi:hypothetical protein